MKIKRILPVVAVLLSLSILPSCESSSDKASASKDKVVEAKSQLAEANEIYRKDLEKYRNEVQIRIDENDRLIVDLKKEAALTKGKLKTSYEKTIADLENRNAMLKKQMKEFNEDKDTNWEKFKSDFNSEMDDLGKAMNDFAKNMRDELK